jgi:hypothetical protein
VKAHIKGFQFIVVVGDIEEGLAERSDCPLHPALFIAGGKITQAYIKTVVAGKVQKIGVIGERVFSDDDRS